MSGWDLLDSALMRQLEQLSIAAKSRSRGAMQGKRRSTDFGSSLEFADYRLYTPGDDPRQLDWHAYGRTGKPFIKLFMDEQELQVNLWLDASKSMDFGAKWEHAKRLAAAVGYIALSRYDRVGAASFTTQMDRRIRQLRGKGSALRLFEFLADGQPAGVGDIAAVFRNPSALPGQSGMTWLFSDFLYEQGVEEALTYLLAAKQEVVAVQILSPEELAPQFAGELRLMDSESGTAKEVAMSGKILQAYQRAVQRHTSELRSFCHARGIAYVLAATDAPITDLLLGEIRRSGLLR